MSVPLIPRELAATVIDDATVAVLIAPGADLTASSGSWTFTDVTDDVMFSGPVSISIGRGDEQSKAQTASCTFRLLNDSGDYTPRRPSGAFFPNMRIGFPVKVVFDSTSTGEITLFAGFCDQLAPSWDASARVPTVELTAKGTIQRLQQGKAALLSVASREALDETLLPSVAAYWPALDNDGATQVGSGLDGGQPMTVSGGAMNFGAYSGFLGSEPIATFGDGANLHGDVDNGRADTTGEAYFRCLMYAGSTLADQVPMMQWLFSGGTVGKAELIYRTGGSVSIKFYTPGGSTIYDSGAIGGFNYDGLAFYLAVEFVQVGSDFDYLIYMGKLLEDGTTIATSYTDTISSRTLGAMTHYDVGASGTMEGWGIGHIGVSNDVDWMFSAVNILLAYQGETVDERLTRIEAESGIPLLVIGTSNIEMGSQPNGTILEVLEDIENTDHGVLYDGVSFGLAYQPRVARENRAFSLDLDISNGDVMPPFEPLENTRLVVNDVTVRARRGSTARRVQEAGEPYAPGDVGTFSSEYTVNTFNDSEVAGHAGWLLRLGTIDVDRFPSLELDFTASPQVAYDWVTMGGVGLRMSVTGLPGTGGADSALIAEGYTMEIGPKDWRVSINCAPYEPYDIELVNTGRVDTAGTVLGASASAGATSLSLDASRPWTITPGSFPFDLNVGGYEVACSDITGPWEFVAFGSGAAADAAAISPGLPTGWAQGDLLLVFHATRDTTYTSIPQTPPTYTSLWTSANMRISYKYAGSSESAPSCTYSGGAGDTCLAVMAAVRPSSPVSGALFGSATQLNSSAQNILFPGLTASAENEVRMYFGWKADDSTGFTGFPEFANSTRVTSTLGNDATIVVGVHPFFDSYSRGSNGTVTITGGAANVSRSAIVAVRPSTDPYQKATISALPGAVSAGADVRLVTPTIVALEES